MDIATIVSVVRYKRAAPLRKQTQLRVDQTQNAKVIRSTVVTKPIDGVDISGNLSLIELFGKLMKVKASRNKPATVELKGGLRLVFHPNKPGGSLRKFTFRDEIKVTRVSIQPRKFTLLGLCNDGHELWLTITYIKKSYTWTHESHSGSGSAGFGDDRQDVTLLGRSADGHRHYRARRGQP